LNLYVRLAAVIGRRRGELCALRWTDIDLDAATVLVARTIVDSADGWVERPISKNRRNMPPLALDATTTALLRTHREAQAAEFDRLGVTVPVDGWVFHRWARVTRQLLPWAPTTVTHRFADIRAQVGLDR